MTNIRFPLPGDAARSHDRRLGSIERRIRAAPQAPSRAWVYFDEVFDYAGGTDPSKKYAPMFTAELVHLFATLTDTGSTATTVQLSINGSDHEVLTVSASADMGVREVSHALAGRVDRGTDADYMQLEATMGTGADGLLVMATFRRRA